MGARADARQKWPEEYVKETKQLVIGRRIRYERLSRLMTQGELGALAGVSPRTISDVEGGWQAPRFSTLKAIAAALGVDPRSLLRP